MALLREHRATHPDWHLRAEPIDRDDGDSGAKLNRPGLDRMRDRAAMAGYERSLRTAPDRLAWNDGHHMRLIDELAPRGGQVALLARPLRQAPHDQCLRQNRGAVAEYARTRITDQLAAAAKLSGAAASWCLGVCHRIAL
jgi:site-specific DNA recombinase